MQVLDEHELPVHPCCDEKLTYIDTLVRQFHEAALAGNDTEADRLEQMVHQFDHAAPRLGEAAIVYARDYGWPVFPLQPGGKAPITRHGFKDATTDLTQIRAWWTANPTANIGLPTGHMFDVVDIDTPRGMVESWQELRDSTAMPDGHGIVTTSSGGRHVYVQPSGGGNLAGLKPGIDYRGRGGFVVAPPSIRADGHRWQWLVKPSPKIVSPVLAGMVA